MEAKYVVSHLDEQLGPFLEGELKAKWAKGELLPIDYIFDEIKQDWILLSEKFEWAKNKLEPLSPPPLREITLNKRTPPEPPKVVVETVTMVKEIAKPTGGIGARVKLVDGVGEIDLSPLQPGAVELILQESTAGQLKMQTPLLIQVKPAEPVTVEWSVPVQQTVGQDAEVLVKALDRTGLLCSHYNDHFVIRVNGSEGSQIPVTLKEGQALVRLQNTKAETWSVEIAYAGSRTLALPAAMKVEWLPGVAAKLILDGPQEYVAGHPLKVHVRAVDAFGNLAKTFQGTVVLEVKAS